MLARRAAYATAVDALGEVREECIGLLVGRLGIVTADLGQQPATAAGSRSRLFRVESGRAHLAHQRVVEALEAEQWMAQQVRNRVGGDIDVGEAEHHEAPAARGHGEGERSTSVTSAQVDSDPTSARAT